MLVLLIRDQKKIRIIYKGETENRNDLIQLTLDFPNNDTSFPNNTIFLQSVKKIKKNSLENKFKKYGKIVNIEINENNGFITFHNKKGALKTLEDKLNIYQNCGLEIVY